MKTMIVMDSSGDLKSMEDTPFQSVPLKIIVGEQEYVDDANLQVDQMLEHLLHHKGRSSTACPSVGEYMEAFGDADLVFCITITAQLSGSYNSVCIAAKTYMEHHPERKVYVIDSLATGPKMILLAEKVRALLAEGLDGDSIYQKVLEYRSNTHLLFTLESLHNLASNGRVPMALAAVTGMLGIRFIGKASEEGKLQMAGKARGEKKLLTEQVKHICSMGYTGGKMLIHHCQNLAGATALFEALKARFPNANIAIGQSGGLCSFYAEQGGMLIGFEI